MTWLALARILVEMFGPWLLKILDDLLMKAKDSLAKTHGEHIAFTSTDAIVKLFEAAKKQTWPWQMWRRQLLDQCCAIAIKRQAEVLNAINGFGSQPYLTFNEQQELAELV